MQTQVIMPDKTDLKPYGEKQVAFDKRYLEMALIWRRIHTV